MPVLANDPASGLCRRFLAFFLWLAFVARPQGDWEELPPSGFPLRNTYPRTELKTYRNK